MRVRRATLLLAVTLPALALADEAPTVIQRDKHFSQDTLEVTRNTAVRFVNDDEFRHNISLRTPTGEIRSGIVQSPGETTIIDFDQTGLFRVTCLIHPQMRMTVVVK